MEKKKRISLIKSDVSQPMANEKIDTETNTNTNTYTNTNTNTNTNTETNTNPNIVIEHSSKGLRSVGVQTEVIKLNSLESISQPRKFARPKTTYIQQQKWPAPKPEVNVDDDKMSARNKSCQTVKTGLKRFMSSFQMGKLKDVMAKRRKLSVIQDRNRLQQLMTIINADPPPPWGEASLMWLEVDKLENRIEEYEKEEKEEIENAANMKIYENEEYENDAYEENENDANEEYENAANEENENHV